VTNTTRAARTDAMLPVADIRVDKPGEDKVVDLSPVFSATAKAAFSVVSVRAGND